MSPGAYSSNRLKIPFQRNKPALHRGQQRGRGSNTNDTVSALTSSDPYDDDSIPVDTNAEPMTNYQALEMEPGSSASPSSSRLIHVPDRDPEASLKYADYYADADQPHGLRGGGSGRSKHGSSEDSEEIYIVRQKFGYCSILFSLAQTAILIVMMVQCGIAPLNLNPMWGPYPSVLSEWGAKNTVLIVDDGEHWRLLTPILLHAGVIHLLCNVAVQLETGVFFEKEWGSLRWCIVYLVSAIGSSVLSCIVMPNALSVGSSGAVMGLFGAKLSEVVLKACERIRTKQDRVGHDVRKEQCCVVSCSVVLILLFSFIPYVDWAAHVGGLAAGILVGWAIFAWEIENRFWRILWFIVGVAGSVVAFVYAIQYLYSGAVDPTEDLRDVCQYYKEMLGGDYECTCQREQNRRSLMESFFFGP